MLLGAAKTGCLLGRKSGWLWKVIQRKAVQMAEEGVEMKRGPASVL